MWAAVDGQPLGRSGGPRLVVMARLTQGLFREVLIGQAGNIAFIYVGSSAMVLATIPTQPMAEVNTEVMAEIISVIFTSSFLEISTEGGG